MNFRTVWNVAILFSFQFSVNPLKTNLFPGVSFLPQSLEFNNVRLFFDNKILDIINVGIIFSHPGDPARCQRDGSTGLDDALKHTKIAFKAEWAGSAMALLNFLAQIV